MFTHMNFILLIYRAYIANRVTDKLTKVCDNIYCCRSGSAADTQAITDIVAYYMDLTRLLCSIILF